MITLPKSWTPVAAGVALVAAFTGCVVAGGSYDETVGVSYGVGFYEPWGYDYGGWGPGYRVGPPRGGERYRERTGRPYHTARSGRSTPSIPTHTRPRR